jgi:hypothetical protein
MDYGIVDGLDDQRNERDFRDTTGLAVLIGGFSQGQGSSWGFCLEVEVEVD